VEIGMLLAARDMTGAVTQGELFNDTDAAWNSTMAAAIVYVLPPDCAATVERVALSRLMVRLAVTWRRRANNVSAMVLLTSLQTNAAEPVDERTRLI
jgi:hypothetical protein